MQTVYKNKITLSCLHSETIQPISSAPCYECLRIMSKIMSLTCYKNLSSCYSEAKAPVNAKAVLACF